MQLVGELFDCEFLCVCCYKFLLDSVFNLDRIEEFRGMTVGEFADTCPVGIYIIRVEGHCTCVIDGVIHDIWNCENEIVDLVWQVC